MTDIVSALRVCAAAGKAEAVASIVLAGVTGGVLLEWADSTSSNKLYSEWLRILVEGSMYIGTVQDMRCKKISKRDPSLYFLERVRETKQLYSSYRMRYHQKSKHPRAQQASLQVGRMLET